MIVKDCSTPPLPTPEAASHLGMKPGTLEIWRVQGKGPKFLKIGRAVRYRVADLDAFLNECSRTSTTEQV